MTLTPDQIVSATGCPLRNVAEHWPNIVAALQEFGIDGPAMEVAAAATVAVETTIFAPIRELHARENRQPELWSEQQRYWPSGFYGRGFIQLTWEGNYHDAGLALGVDLVGNPDLAMEPVTAARVLAWFMKTKSVPTAAALGDWKRVRRQVNGPGLRSLDEFLAIVAKLTPSGPEAA